MRHRGERMRHRGERMRHRSELLMSRKRGDSLTRTPRCISYARYLPEFVTIHRLNAFLKMLVRDSSAVSGSVIANLSQVILKFSRKG